MAAACPSRSSARSVMSRALPIGVATMTSPDTAAEPLRSPGDGLLIERSSLPSAAIWWGGEIARAAAVLDVSDVRFFAMAPTASRGRRPRGRVVRAGGLRILEGSHTVGADTSHAPAADGAD